MALFRRKESGGELGRNGREDIMVWPRIILGRIHACVGRALGYVYGQSDTSGT